MLLVASTASWALGAHSAPAQHALAAAHWHEASLVLVHRPGEEVFPGLLHPAAALFADTFSLEGAASEHRQFVDMLKNRGVNEVVEVVDVLLEGTENPLGEARRELAELAKSMTTLDVSRLEPQFRKAQQTYFANIVEKMAPRTLVRMVLERPTVVLRHGKCGASMQESCLLADYQIQPLMNLYFPASERVFIGQGLRTNAVAIAEMLNYDVFDAREVIVVKDAWQNPQEMHLDTYFNLLDANLALLVADRHERDCNVRRNSKCLQADVWIRNARGAYTLTRKNADFVRLLEERGIQIIAVSVEDQKAYGINVLTIGPRRVVGAEGVSEAYKRALATESVDATWVRFDNLARGYGSADCITQVLRRTPSK